LLVWRDKMRAIVTCECCGHRQAVARAIRIPEAFHVVCHECEGVLRVEVTETDLKGAQKSMGRSRRARV
jgi:transcription elongation factor Elf1